MRRTLQKSQLLRSSSKSCKLNETSNKQICFRCIQKPHICFCGAKLRHSEVRPESDCNHECPGDETQKCGGGWRNSLYKWFNERSTQGDLGKSYYMTIYSKINRDVFPAEATWVRSLTECGSRCLTERECQFFDVERYCISLVFFTLL